MPDIMPAEPGAFAMTDIEDGLRGPDGETFRAQLVDRLDRRAAEFADKLRIGLSPTDYAQAEAIAKALAAAREVVLAYPGKRR